MRNRIGLGVMVLAFSFAQAQRAQAEPAGFALDHYAPAERGSDWFAVESLDLRGHLRPSVGLTLDYAYHPLITTDASGTRVSALVSDQMFAHLGGTLVLNDRFRIGLSIPVQLYATGEPVTVHGVSHAPPAHSLSLGDLRLGGDVRVFGEYGEVATLAFGAQLLLPTGDPKSYSGDGSLRVAPRALFAGELGGFVYAARLGMSLGESEAFGGSELGSRFNFGGAFGVRLARQKLVIGPELFGNTVVSNGVAFSQRATPLEGLFGAHYWLSDSWRVGTAISGGITAGFGTPLVRYLASVDWSPPVEAPRPPSDRDSDRIVDTEDACPDTPGLPSTERERNGCPPPSDRDHDTILDPVDACPDVPGVASTDPKTNGCVAEVPCPTVPGPKSDDPNLSRCPTDEDRDTILDPDDACPTVPGRKTADPKSNGCSDPDPDGDGVQNPEDACPTVPGPAHADPKRNGCPQAFVQGDQIVIVDQIKFKTGSAQLLGDPDSERVLEAVLGVLTQHPEIEFLRVEGHTDSRGSAGLNRQLSGRRAAAVVAWLTKRGIAARRLVSKGWGADHPIDDNASEAGRKNNRRVEFHIDDTRGSAGPKPGPSAAPTPPPAATPPTRSSP